MGRSKRKTGNWLITYSDLVTLLLVFFVLLYMLTPGIDDSTFDTFISHFQRSVGVMEQQSVQSSQSSARDRFLEQLMEQWQAFEHFLEEQGLSSQVNVELVDEGIRITMSDDMTFRSGSSQLLPEARTVLGELTSMLDDDVEELEVQGHTDDVPLSQGSAYRTNWHLGAARSVSVVLFLQDRITLKPERFRATSLGEYRPVASNRSPEGRSRNRRVEIYVRYIQLSMPAEATDFSDNVPDGFAVPETEGAGE